MELWEATAFAVRQIEEAMFKPRKALCEMCNDPMDPRDLEDSAHFGHGHCYLCILECVAE